MRALLGALLVIASCRTPTEPSSPAAAGDAAQAQVQAPWASSDNPASPSVDPSLPYDGPLVVGGRSGVVRLDARGAPVETISDKPGLRPRWMRPGASIAVLRPAERWSLVELELESKAERVIADDLLGDALTCPGSGGQGLPESADLHVHEDADFAVNVERGLACVALMDRNANMAEVRVEVKVPLDRPQELRRALVVAVNCEVAPTGDGDEVCLTMPSGMRVGVHDDSTGKPEAVGPYRLQEGKLLRRVEGRDEVMAGPFPLLDDQGKADPKHGMYGLGTFEPHSRSPSGRWVVLTGNQSMGDYIHSEWLLLDTSRGELFAVRGATWPPPLTSTELLALTATGNDIVGESTIVWLSEDRLVVDRWLVLPGEAVVELPGDLAR